MPSPKDITGALGDWEKRKPVPEFSQSTAPQSVERPKPPRERRLNPDLFSVWVYVLLFLALAGQLGMLVALDVF
jgi:hypothetical protein